MKKLKFSELNLSAEIQNAILEMGFEEASPIQSEAIPVILKGKISSDTLKPVPVKRPHLQFPRLNFSRWKVNIYKL